MNVNNKMDQIVVDSFYLQMQLLLLEWECTFCNVLAADKDNFLIQLNHCINVLLAVIYLLYTNFDILI